jgi:anaerobic sulfite reductase subunit B
MTPSGAPVLPVRYQVTERLTETYDTVTLDLRPVDRPIQPPQPGQFTMLYAPGIGEVPVSVSGTGPGGVLAQTVRAVGAVTRALCGRGPGQLVGVRGPYGTHWDVASAAGGDLLVVAGGIGLAPLRGALLAALGQRDRYRRVVVLIGARSPEELVFGHELKHWRRAGAEVEVTVDRAAAGWAGQVGVVTQLLPRAGIDPARTTALVCGPEVMMRLTARDLLALGVPATRVRVSLERNMLCGVAECGHCQLGPLLLCRDGPVVSYAAAAPLMAIREL